MNKFTVVTGYVSHNKFGFPVDDFAPYWLQSVLRQKPAHIFVVEHDRKFPISHPDLTVIPAANLGHIHQLVKKQQPYKDHHWCGWSAVALLGAMLAYNREEDFLFVEQDCLMFGNTAEAIYAQVERTKKKMLFGSCKIMGAAQSLFWVKHDFIPSFVSYYSGLWHEASEPRLRSEHKFAKMEKDYGCVGRFPFGYDRDRPFAYNEPAWYAQQISWSELQEFIKRELI
jgi:hypothetical protein